MLECQNLFCIYWRDGSCTLEQISLDEQGRCCECIYVNIEEEFLQKYREELLDYYEK